MFEKSTTRQLRELRVHTRTAALLAKVLLAELARASLEAADVRDRIRRRRVSPWRRRALELGAAAAVLTTAGLVARHAMHGPDGSPDEKPATA